MMLVPLVLDIDNLHLVLDVPGILVNGTYAVHVHRNGVDESDHVLEVTSIYGSSYGVQFRLDPTEDGGCWGVNRIDNRLDWKWWLPHIVAWALQHRNVWEDRERLREQFRKERREVCDRIHAEEYWYFQGDGEDHLESLTCPVIIQPESLRRIVERAEDADELDAMFDMQHRRTVEADAAYVASHPRPEFPNGYLPDLGTLIEWLMKRAVDAEAAFFRAEASEHALGAEVADLLGRAGIALDEHSPAGVAEALAKVVVTRAAPC